ncbi:PREDICTED: uncharacterized protein LOC106750299 isoform X2 [Dinoponera quadriceps]|uniref:Uncharacterized protein LOC106750299 isoform X2 n=1 Tax=Dinoponera quadriceps TaxID=609295 RepID=A0A6P3Y581_DINQU|nr:PREDICTED: uncharacterized protein LOC106750299 isoform X2 [Dinoponera quadriceps]
MSFVYVSRIKSQVRGLEIRLSRAGNPYDDICTVNGRGGEGNQRYVSAPMYPGKVAVSFFSLTATAGRTRQENSGLVKNITAYRAILLKECCVEVRDQGIQAGEREGPSEGEREEGGEESEHRYRRRIVPPRKCPVRDEEVKQRC